MYSLARLTRERQARSGCTTARTAMHEIVINRPLEIQLDD
jgi:hypothetical protein